jgi:thiamine kinase-like enzyme
MFQPSWNNFIQSKWDIFRSKWNFLLSKQQLDIGQYIVDNFTVIQEKLSDKNLTFCHGDVKSANIFYKFIKSSNTYEPYFIDWQYIIHGKGVQDLVFFMIESFESDKMKLYKTIFKEYYYIKLVDNGINYYSKNDYEEDFKTASYYFPFFVAIWFGTMNEEELIDKNFPLEYIKKLFHFYIS